MKINYCEIPMEVAYEFYKGEPATWDYPGSSDEVVIESVEVNNVDIFNLLSPDQLYDLENIIIENL